MSEINKNEKMFFFRRHSRNLLKQILDRQHVPSVIVLQTLANMVKLARDIYGKKEVDETIRHETEMSDARDAGLCESCLKNPINPDDGWLCKACSEFETDIVPKTPIH